MCHEACLSDSRLRAAIVQMVFIIPMGVGLIRLVTLGHFVGCVVKLSTLPMAGSENQFVPILD